jgi:hypothetical protein
MNRILKVADTVGGVFQSMTEMLNPLSPEAFALDWSVFDLGEVIAEDRWDLNLPFLHSRVAGSPTGLELSFDDLAAFGSRVRQVIDGVFVGCRRPNALPLRSDDDVTVLGKADMLIAAIDSSFWLVSGADEVLSRVEVRFEKVTLEKSAEVQLSTWGRNSS